MLRPDDYSAGELAELLCDVIEVLDFITDAGRAKWSRGGKAIPADSLDRLLQFKKSLREE